MVERPDAAGNGRMVGLVPAPRPERDIADVARVRAGVDTTAPGLIQSPPDEPRDALTGAGIGPLPSPPGRATSGTRR